MTDATRPARRERGAARPAAPERASAAVGMDEVAGAEVDFRALLEEEGDSLRHQIAELGFGDAGGLNYDSNFADTSQVTAERGEAEALVGQLREALEGVENALRKVEDGTYGTCERCGKAITGARLEAKPASTHCIDCASARR